MAVRLSSSASEIDDRPSLRSISVVPTEDEHLSEYIAKADQRRAFISG